MKISKYMAAGSYFVAATSALGLIGAISAEDLLGILFFSIACPLLIYMGRKAPKWFDNSQPVHEGMFQRTIEETEHLQRLQYIKHMVIKGRIMSAIGLALGAFCLNVWWHWAFEAEKNSTEFFLFGAIVLIAIISAIYHLMKLVLELRRWNREAPEFIKDVHTRLVGDQRIRNKAI